MGTVVTRIDPMATNPLVQANTTLGFQRGVVRITANQYESPLALRRKGRRSWPNSHHAGGSSFGRL